MAVITTSTFDPLKARCNVRLQQGVPIVDADWNELDDIRKFELRTYLKWFVGDGIPDGSDAFKVDAITPLVVDDFIVRAGVVAPPPGTTRYDQGLRFAGHAIVDGLDVIIPADMRYKAQPLFTAAAFGIPQIAPMPTVAGPVAVYLDVWERLVTSQEDPSLVLSGIGTESCARMKREWCVRTRSGNVVPQATNTDFIAGHSYYLLAIINRTLSGGNPVPIAPTDVLDHRHVKLSLASIESRLAFVENILAVIPVVPGNIQQGSSLGTPISGAFGKIAELTALRPGTYRVDTTLANPPVGYGQPLRSGIISRVFVNDVASPQSSDRSLTTVSGPIVVATENITVAAGDRLQLYARKADAALSSAGVTGAITVYIKNPLDPAVI